jgi:hypothetical protein
MDDEMMDIDETPGGQLLQLAELLRQPSAPQRRRRVPVDIPIRASDAAAAGGLEIVHRTVAAVASADDPAIRPKAASVIAALAAMKPSGPMESSLAGLFVAMSAAALDSLAVARVAGFDSLIGVTLLSRAEKLTCRAVELAEVIACPGPRDHRRKIVIQHIHEAP